MTNGDAAPRTVVTLVSTLARCGPINVVREVLTHLEPAKYRAVVVTLSPEHGDSRIDEFRASGIPVKQLNMSRTASLLAGRHTLKRAIEFFGADITHCHGFRADILAAAAGAACPLVSTVHADLAQDYTLAYGRLFGTIMTHREYRALRRFHAVVAVSDITAKRAAQFGVRASVIPNGIDIATYTPRASLEELRDGRRNLGWPEDALVVLHTGVLTQRKRPLDVIAAFRQSILSKKGLLVFAGDGPLLARCKQAAQDSRNILFLGHRSDVAMLLGSANAVVSSSTSEGLPMALLEACASGLRVLATDIQAHGYIAGLFPEQVDLFPVADCAGLTERLNDLSRSSDSTPIAPPPESLRAISAERMSSNYQDVYDRVLSRP